MNNVTNAEQAARLALEAAQRARIQGTFGVGAALVEDTTGSVLDVASNDVVRPVGRGTTGNSSREQRSEHFTHDPTAHGERQLISRYFERVGNGEALPSPGNLTIVSSLEPCAMCAGAILAGGFKVGVVALDPVAGLGAAGSRNFESLPDAIRVLAEDSFAYYEVPEIRPFVGANEVAFGGRSQARTIARQIHDACEEVFQGSLERAMAVVSEGGQENSSADPLDLPPNDPFRAVLGERLPHFLALRLEDPGEPDRKLIDLLEDLASGDPGQEGATALIDRFGNLLIASGGNPEAGPVSSSLAESIRRYSRVRFDLRADPEVAEPYGRYLPHPKFGTVFRYPVPESDSPSTLFELGVYGSTMEGPLPSWNRPNLRFIGRDVDESRTRQDLLGLVQALPHFYTEIVELDLAVNSI